MNARNLAKRIDHTILKPNVSDAELKKFFRDALRYNFRAICINQAILDRIPRTIFKKLKEKDILIAVVVDFPLGQGGYINKHFQATLAREKGADEIDVVWNIGAFLNQHYEQVLDELKPLANALPTKVIIETGHLIVPGFPQKTRSNLVKAVKLVDESGAFYIKTSTGYEPKVDLKTKAEHIKIFKETIPDLEVKAAGGIKTLEDAKLMLDAGADILGTSSGVDIVKEAMSEVIENAKS